MDEQTLQALSRALTLLIFRNGAVEELHAKGERLTDETMRILNMDINNRFYTLLALWFNGTEEDNAKLERTLNFLARFYGREWDKAQRIKLI